MNEQIRSFLDAIDEQLANFAATGEHLDLYLLGRGALVTRHGFRLATRDVDIVKDSDSPLQAKAIELFGKESAFARIIGLYLDPVAEGLPPLPNGYKKRSEPIVGTWQVIRIWILDIHDIAVSKLNRFHAGDREDLQQMCDRELLTVGKLHLALDRAFPWRSPKDEDAEDDPDTPEWGRCLKNFRRVAAYLKGEARTI